MARACGSLPLLWLIMTDMWIHEIKTWQDCVRTIFVLCFVVAAMLVHCLTWSLVTAASWSVDYCSWLIKSEVTSCFEPIKRWMESWTWERTFLTDVFLFLWRIRNPRQLWSSPGIGSHDYEYMYIPLRLLWQWCGIECFEQSVGVSPYQATPADNKHGSWVCSNRVGS